MKKLLQSFCLLVAGVVLSTAALAQDKVVYHIDDAASQPTKGLRNIPNHFHAHARPEGGFFGPGGGPKAMLG